MTFDESKSEDRQYPHLLTLLSVSSAMVGVCLTAIGLIGIMRWLSAVQTLVDDLLAVGAVLFMISAVMSFLGMAHERHHDLAALRADVGPRVLPGPRTGSDCHSVACLDGHLTVVW